MGAPDLPDGRDSPGAERLERLPYGHPSSPYRDDGTRKPPVLDVKTVELPVEADYGPPGPDSARPGRTAAAGRHADLREAGQPAGSPGERPSAGKLAAAGEQAAGDRPAAAGEPATADRKFATDRPAATDRATAEDRPAATDRAAAAGSTAAAYRPAAAAGPGADRVGAEGGGPGPADVRAGGDGWREALPELRARWQAHLARWPQAERPAADRPGDEPGPGGARAGST